MIRLCTLLLLLPLMSLSQDKYEYHHSINKQKTNSDYYQIAYGKQDDKPWPPSDNNRKPWPPSDTPAKRNPKDVMLNKILDMKHNR